MCSGNTALQCTFKLYIVEKESTNVIWPRLGLHASKLKIVSVYRDVSLVDVVKKGVERDTLCFAPLSRIWVFVRIQHGVHYDGKNSRIIGTPSAIS